MLGGYSFASWTKSSIGIASGNRHLLVAFNNSISQQGKYFANSVKVGGVTSSANEGKNSSDLKLESNMKQMVIQQS